MCPVTLAGRAEEREIERRLLIRYHRFGDLRARDDVVERLLPFARALARRYANSDESMDDLVQVASLGLVKAIDRFDPERDNSFTSYAAPTILGELKRHFRDRGWSLHVPRSLQERALAVTRESELLSKKLARTPNPREVAKAMGRPLTEVLEAQEVAASYQAESLDAPAARDAEDERFELVQTIGHDDPSYESVEERDAIAHMWRGLPDLERQVLALRCMTDLTQREIGERVGFSQMQVSRLMRRALTRVETAAAA